VRLDADNQVQPDALLRIKIAGQSTISDDDYIEGAPELIVEIAASSASYDFTINGEFIVVIKCKNILFGEFMNVN
jgi:Uma2 family endonuclease